MRTVTPTVGSRRPTLELRSTEEGRPTTVLLTRNQAASSSNGDEEDTLQRLLRPVASLQACSDEQTWLNVEAEERHRKAEEEELCHQLTAVKATVEKLGGAVAPLLTPSTQVFWAQPFSEEIDETVIPLNFREVVIKPFDRTQDPHIHLQAFQT
ncbi:hypothetical protein CR513_49889, partial [Mucuna pruriens]